jgi:hypothetical protein
MGPRSHEENQVRKLQFMALIGAETKQLVILSRRRLSHAGSVRPKKGLRTRLRSGDHIAAKGRAVLSTDDRLNIVVNATDDDLARLMTLNGADTGQRKLS